MCNLGEPTHTLVPCWMHEPLRASKERVYGLFRPSPPGHTIYLVQFQPWNCCGLRWEIIDVGPPFFHTSITTRDVGRWRQKWLVGSTPPSSNVQSMEVGSYHFMGVPSLESQVWHGCLHGNIFLEVNPQHKSCEYSLHKMIKLQLYW